VLRDFSCAHKLSDRSKIKGDPKYIFAPKYPSDIKGWGKLKGIKIKNNRIQLWKIVKKDGTDFYSGSINYDTNKEIIDPNWNDNFNGECGHGLHLADSPSGARFFYNYRHLEEARLFKVSDNIDDCKCFGGLSKYPMKIRARACRKVKEYSIDYIEEI